MSAFPRKRTHRGRISWGACPARSDIFLKIIFECAHTVTLPIKSMRQEGTNDRFPCWPLSMKPGTACRKIAEVLREQANALHDVELKAEYQYLVRGFLRLAKQFEEDMDSVSDSENRVSIFRRRLR